MSSIRDNHNCGTVGDFLREQVKKDSQVSIVSAYFTIYAYHQLRKQLDQIGSLRFLFGEPTFITTIDPEKVETKLFQIEDSHLAIPTENRLTQKSLARDCRNWIQEKVAIRSMVKPNFLHGKLYHILQPGGVVKAIVGSSNFTVNGLGLGGSKNIELNLVVDSDRDRDDLLKWFDGIWNDATGLVEDVKEAVLRYLDQLYADNSPEFLYFKTLFHVFEKFLDESRKGGLLNEQTGFFDSAVWNALYDFQKDGVKGAINKILKHNGCIIADSVGLGKTFEALAVVKYFELLNQRVLVVCPKKLSGNWTIYQATQNHSLNPFPQDRFGYTVLYHTDMGRLSGRSEGNGIDLETFNWGAYDLVVIDESHNFRGNPVERLREDGSRTMNRALWLMEKVIKSGVKTRVLMLSATPVNNTLKDLRNQIAFITEGRNDALEETSGVRDIAQTLKNAQTAFTNWADPRNANRTLSQLLEKLDSGFFKILDELTIARSRKHIKNFYNLAAIGNFPNREKPLSLYPVIDLSQRFPSYDHLNQQILRYKLAVFNPSSYIKPDFVAKYEALEGGAYLNFRQKDRENTLIAMMKVNFLKRLESSIESFEISLDRTIKKIEDLEERIETFQKANGPGLAQTVEMDDPDPEDFETEEIDAERWQVGKKLKFDLADLDLDRWVRDLRADKDELIGLYNNAASVSVDRDAKLAELKRQIEEKLTCPFNPGNCKILIFTAFADTAQYLYDSVEAWYRTRFQRECALVCGTHTQTSLGRNDYDSILMNFSPVSKKRSQMPQAHQGAEIDLLIATDCISEGQNLQDCDLLINYDIHWNPVRIIQRFGRIDRLGSRNKAIRLVNFWPTRDLDAYINLKARVEARMALVDVAGAGDDNILNAEELQDLVSEDLKYRNHQLKRLQEEVLDLEDMDSSVSLTDFTLDDFRVELLRFLEENKRRLAQTPLGLYAIVPTPSGTKFSQTEKDIIKPGVVFCLRQKADAVGAEVVNPLSPYFLAYVRNDGSVRYNFTQTKQILEMMRRLCQGSSAPHAALCEAFNGETADGSKMDQYAGLLKMAADEMVRVHQKRDAQRLVTGGRGAVVQPQENQITHLDQFELVTWLIIKEEDP